MTPADLAAGIRRLAPCRRDPEAFHLARDQIARAVAALPLGQPCAVCPATRHRRLLAAAGAALRRQRDALAVAHRLIASARPPAPVRRLAPDPRQLSLPIERTAAS